MSPSLIFCPTAYLSTGWANNVSIMVDEDGWIIDVVPETTADPTGFVASGAVIPGMPNVHSHAFQRAMAGLTERRVTGKDSFWSWRDTMYKFVDRLDPEAIQAIATQLYVDLLRHGYTSVGEFHYLHHQPDGTPYDNPAELADRHIAASQTAGIAITMLPVLYTYGGFDRRPLSGGQRRFFHETKPYFAMLQDLFERHSHDAQVRIGFSAHSLRAVAIDELPGALEQLSAIDATMPKHIHIAEQQAEVDQCVAAHGKRPVELLFSALDGQIDHRWCFIHATHMNEQETSAMADSGAIAGLCPATEANLGDGFFSALEFVAESGLFAIGSDSHISVSPWEELRTIEYGLRLRTQRRNLMATERDSTGTALYQTALGGGQKALGRPIGKIAVGARADFLIVDSSAPALVGREGAAIFDTLVFCGDSTMIRDVFVGGQHVIQDGKHPEQEAIEQTYRRHVEPIVQSL